MLDISIPFTRTSVGLLKMDFLSSRSYWVGSMSWSPGGLFLACVLKRGSLLMVSRLGGLLSLTSSGCNVDLGLHSSYPCTLSSLTGIHLRHFAHHVGLVANYWFVWAEVLYSYFFSLVCGHVFIDCFPFTFQVIASLPSIVSIVEVWIQCENCNFFVI